MPSDTFGIAYDNLSYVELYLLACTSKSMQERLRSLRRPGFAYHLSHNEMMVRICLRVAHNVLPMRLLYWAEGTKDCIATTYTFANWSILEAAASSGNITLLGKWIDQGLPLKRTTILYIKAVRRGQTAVCKLLSGMRAVDVTPDLHNSLEPRDEHFLLSSPSEGSNYLVVKWLLQKRHRKCRNILIAAVAVSDIQTLELLLDFDNVKRAFSDKFTDSYMEYASSTLHHTAISTQQPKAASWLINNNFIPRFAALSLSIREANLSLVDVYYQFFGKDAWTREHTVEFLRCFPEDRKYLVDRGLL